MGTPSYTQLTMSQQAHANGPAGASSAPSRAASAGGKAFSASAKKDPALLPLVLIVGGVVTTAAYFMSNKWTAPTAEKKFAPIGRPWDANSPLHKYRYMRKDGKIEHALPASSYETVPVSGNIDRLRKFSAEKRAAEQKQ